jgi:hypothetical protein
VKEDVLMHKDDAASDGAVGPEANSGWRPIETAPNNERLLLWDGFTVFEGFNSWSIAGGKRRDFWVTAGLFERPWTTHWMPLPPPPMKEARP